MSLTYRLLYRIGFTPWVRDQPGDQLRGLVEGPEALSPGAALEIGCGTGTDALYLAEHGWDVTAVDIVPTAIAKARRRGVDRGLRVRWIRGDARALGELGIGAGYRLILDVGCFHGLTDAARESCARVLTEAAAPGAVLLSFAFEPGRRGPGHRGISSEELLRRLGPQWELVSTTPEPGFCGPLGNANPTWYRFLRMGGRGDAEATRLA